MVVPIPNQKANMTEEQLKDRMDFIVREIQRTGLAAFYNRSVAGETVTSCLICLDRNDPLGLPLLACYDASGRQKLAAISWMTLPHAMTYGCAMEPDWKVADDIHPFGILDKTHYVVKTSIDYTKINCDFASLEHLLQTLRRQKSVFVYSKDGPSHTPVSGTVWFDCETGKSYLLGTSSSGISFNFNAIEIHLRSGVLVTEPTACQPVTTRMDRLPGLLDGLSKQAVFFDYRDGAGQRTDPHSLLNPDNAFMKTVQAQGGLTVLQMDATGITHYQSLPSFIVVQRPESGAIVLFIKADPNDVVRTIFSFIEMMEYSGTIVTHHGDAAFVTNLAKDRVADAAALGNYIKSKQPKLAGPVFRFHGGEWTQLL